MTPVVTAIVVDIHTLASSVNGRIDVMSDCAHLLMALMIMLMRKSQLVSVCLLSSHHGCYHNELNPQLLQVNL